MALTPSQRPTREWPLLLLALAVVGFICIPLSQSLLGDSVVNPWVNWDACSSARNRSPVPAVSPGLA
jgi:hypothetical protein